MNYEIWKQNVPSEIAGDQLWQVEAYRLALFAADVGWQDVTKLMQDKRTVGNYVHFLLFTLQRSNS